MIAGPTAIGVVLAGGASTRMGRDKAAAELGGSRLIDHVLNAIVAVDLVPVVAGPERPDVAAQFVADPPGLAGPAAGLVAAMRSHPGTDVVLVGTDQPYVRPETIRQLLEIDQPLVAPRDGRRQTLCAVYRAACRPQLEALLVTNPSPSLQTLFDAEGTDVAETEWRRWGEDGRSWLSIDTPEALSAAEATWPDPPHGTIRP